MGDLDRTTLREREAHHRLTNCLAEAAASIRRARRRVRDPEAAAALTEAELRIEGGARLHRRLLDAEKAGGLRLDLLLREAAADVARATGLDVELEAAPHEVDGAIAADLLRASSELVTNAARHAYPAGAPGGVTIRLGAARRGSVRLTVEDEGRGLPPDFELGAAPGWGMRIATQVAQRLGGALVAESRSHGARFTLRLPASLFRGAEAAQTESDSPSMMRA